MISEVLVEVYDFKNIINKKGTIVELAENPTIVSEACFFFVNVNPFKISK